MGVNFDGNTVRSAATSAGVLPLWYFICSPPFLAVAEEVLIQRKRVLLARAYCRSRSHDIVDAEYQG